MFPWKMLFRFFSATVLFATGGFAAGHDLPVPFDAAPEAAAPAPVSDAVDTTTTTVAPVHESTTTTTAPDAPVVEPVPVPVTIDPTEIDPAPTAPSAPTTTKPAKPTAGVPADPSDTPPAAPVDGDAAAVCAAAKTKACGPAAPTAAPARDNSHQARVERCQDWWNSLAQAFDQNGRPEWATRARAVAGRCDAMITRWEEAQQRWEERRKAKGDHNDDGHPDNGRSFRRDGRDDRNGPKEARAAKVSRHSEGRH